MDILFAMYGQAEHVMYAAEYRPSKLSAGPTRRLLLMKRGARMMGCRRVRPVAAGRARMGEVCSMVGCRPHPRPQARAGGSRAPAMP